VIQKDMLFLSQRGEAQGYLLRKRHVSSITEGLYDEKNKEELLLYCRNLPASLK